MHLFPHISFTDAAHGGRGVLLCWSLEDLVEQYLCCSITGEASAPFSPCPFSEENPLFVGLVKSLFFSHLAILVSWSLSEMT